MWRKIHSNRDPKDTLYSELKKEFAPYFGKAGSAFGSLLSRHPKFLFGLMVAAMSCSLILSFTVFRHHEVKRSVVARHQVSPVEDGFGQIMAAAEKIRETLRLKHLVDSITAKKQFTSADSVALDSALDRLKQLRKTN